MDLVSAADDLYGLPLAEFVVARTRLEKQARAAGDRVLASDIRALRKPTQAAWVVNRLLRDDRELIDDVLHLGDELRDAQRSGDATRMRDLTDRRHELFAAVRGRAEELVTGDGRRLTPTVAQALERTLAAAMADPDAANAVRTGRLVTDLETTGWGPVDLDQATAVAHEPARTDSGSGDDEPTAAGTTDDDGTAARRAAARRAAELRDSERARTEAEEAAARATSVLGEAEDALRTATAEQQRLADRVAEIREELRRVEAEADDADQAASAAHEAVADARQEADRAAREVAAARRRVEDLTDR
jgi:hypothetical protein